MNRPLRTHSGPPRWPSYRGVSHLVGVSPSGSVTVYVDPNLGPQGIQNATDLVNDADRVFDLNNSIFNTTGAPVSAIVFALGGVVDGSAGADHADCTFQSGGAIEVDASLGNPARVSGLFEAELSECAMNGRLCGLSTGEALSRWCAAIASNNALVDFTTAPDWAEHGARNFVDRTDPTDRNPLSTGCGVAFISWLISQGHKLPQIAQEMVALGDTGTLAELYARLTGERQSQAWPDFEQAIKGLPDGVSSDDPFEAFATAM